VFKRGDLQNRRRQEIETLLFMLIYVYFYIRKWREGKNVANQEQLILLKSGREEWNSWIRQTREIIDLKGADLKEIDLSKAYLICANLSGANLSGANLSKTLLGLANLSGANLSGANLNNAILQAANLDLTDFRGANLQAADLSRTDLRNTQLNNVSLQAANLSEANLHSTNLSNIDCSGADLSTANLSFANLRSTCLRGTYLSCADLSFADLSFADLSFADLTSTNLSGAKLHSTNLRKVDLSSANLSGADLTGQDLSNRDLRNINLDRVNLSQANLKGANLTGQNLSTKDLSGANLSGANLSRTLLIGTNLTGATLTDCNIYGIAAWNVQLENAIQKNLIITQENEATITIDNLKVAQFIYLMLNNKEIRDVLDTIAKKAVLILGRFTPERKVVLDELREVLRTKDYLPILFDFQRPTSQDLTGTVSTLAHISRFIIVDLTDPSCSPYEIGLVASCRKPIKPIFQPSKETQHEFSMLKDLRKRHDWILPTYQYNSIESLLHSLQEKVIEPAEKKVKELEREKITDNE
jgi:uncharacterized protein YjbI with pentapeptide repeats